MNHAINIKELKGISETLLITVYLRNLETQRKNGIIRDNKSVEIIHKIDYDYEKYKSQYASNFNQAIIAIRTQIIDDFVENIITHYPNTTIVNLGTGLCTRFFRLDNKRTLWYGIDLPRVKPIWDCLIGESELYKYLSYSILEFDWIEKIRELKSEKILFIAEGILMYFSESEVKQLINSIQYHFPGSEIIFDALGIMTVQNSNINSNSAKINASYKWGIDDLQEMKNWNCKLEIIESWFCLERHRLRLGCLGLLSYIPIFKKQVQIGHLRFT